MNKEENTFLKYLSDDLKPFADNTDCCTFIVRLRKENNEKDKEIERLTKELNLARFVINESLKFIREYCIDDEFYINLSYKEKAIVNLYERLSDYMKGGEYND